MAGVTWLVIGGPVTFPDHLERHRISQHSVENLLSLAEGLNPGFPRHSTAHGPHTLQRLRAMRDNGDNPSPAAHVQDRLGQSLLALGIEIRRRLIEHDQEWFAVEGAR